MARNSLIRFIPLLQKRYSINTCSRLSGKDWAFRKQSNMADSTELFELESFAIKKVEIFAEFALANKLAISQMF